MAVTAPDTTEQARNEKRKTPRGQYGRLALVELDKTDLRRALLEIGEALRALESIHSPENSGVVKTQKLLQVREALGHAHLGSRFVIDVLSRNDY